MLFVSVRRSLDRIVGDVGLLAGVARRLQEEGRWMGRAVRRLEGFRAAGGRSQSRVRGVQNVHAFTQFSHGFFVRIVMNLFQRSHSVSLCL